MNKNEIIETLEHFTTENHSLQAQQVTILSLLLKKGIISEEEYLETHMEIVDTMREVGIIP